MRLHTLLAVGIFCIAARAAEPVRIYLANDDHTDFMWTADADTYADVFVEMLDWHLKLADETATNGPPYRNRFNADGNYWLWTYEQKKTPAEFARLIGRLKDGTLSAPLNALVSCYGGQPAEAVLRGMYYAGRLERRHDLRFRLAVAMEDQTLPLGLASLFAGSGARFSWRGVCGCASRFDNRVLGSRPHEIYWWTGHDEQRLLLKWHSLAPAGNQHSGGYAEAFDPVAAVQFLDSDPGFLRRYRARGAAEPYRVRAAFGFGWDALNRKTGQPYAADPEKYPLTDHFHRIAERQSTPERQVIVSNEQDFFEDFETTHGASLDRMAVTYGNEWDLYSASMVETSARVKRAVEKLRSAEMLATLVSLKHPAFMTSHRDARDRAFHALGLYWEHNWTADGPIPRPQRAAWQEQMAAQIESFVNTLHDAAVRHLGAMIVRPADANRFFVLNPLGWPRTEAADFAYTGPDDIHVRDITNGQDVPHQFLTLNGSRFLRILAADVPSAGYKVFQILPSKGIVATDDAATVGGEAGSTLENGWVKLVIERDGAIRSFTDKQRGQTELAATLGGLKLNDFVANSDEGEPLHVEHRGPVSVTLLARSRAGLPHTTAITLYRSSDRVDIRNELHANFGDVRHWAFSFALNQPSVRTEEVGAVILNQLQSAGGDYADTHARYDYLTVNHFADLTDGSGTKGMTVSNPDLAFARLGHSTATHLDTTTPQLHLLAGGQVDGPNLGIRGQNGNTRFLQRFALRPHGGYHPAAAMKFALEHQNPFVTGALAGSGSGVYPETTHSLLKVSNPDVLLWALKPHEDGIERGLVVRLWNLSDQPAEADLTFAGGISVAHRMTHIETDLEAISLTAAGTLPAKFTRQQIQTYRTTAERRALPNEWPTRVELNLHETRRLSRNGGAAHQFKLLSITHHTMPYRRNAADGTIIYAATVEMEVDGVPVTLTARPYQFPTVVGGLRMLIENTKTWSESGTVAATAQAKDLSFTFTHVGEPWGPADIRFPVGSFRWHATTYHNTWMGLVPQDDQVYYHRGEDFGAQPNLLPLLAPRAGSVTALPSVRLRDADHAVYQFHHMFEDHIYVAEGQSVDAGFTLAHTGGHGNGNDDQHLHVTITAPDGTPRNTYPMMAEAYLRDYPDSGIANAGGYQFMLPGQTITLDASRSLARPGRTITGYRWILHDGTEVPSPTANLTLSTSGYFAQELRVTYDDGSEQRDFTPVRVFSADGAGQAGMLGFIYQHPVRGIRPGTPVTLMHNSWMVGVSSRSIDFGDGSPPEVVTGHKPTMTHAYAAPGLYTVTISVGTSQVLKTSVLVEAAVPVTATPPADARPPLPRLKVSDNHRFLVTAEGKPFFWLGDTAWELFHRLDRVEAELYLRDRAAKGFNVIQAVALAELGGLTVPNRQGHLPLEDKDPARPAMKPGPDNDYWDFVDTILDQAARRGLYVGFLPTWGSYVTSSAFDGKVNGIFNVTNALAYGHFLGTRYRDRSNLIWILGGDKAPSTPEAVAIWRAMAKGITQGVTGREDDDGVLMTYHTSGPGHVSDYLHDEPWLDFTSAQSSHGDLVESWRFIEKHWNRQPVKPVIDLESSYPDALILAAWLPEPLRAAHPSTKPSNDDHARRAAYWAVFAGAAGHTYGHNSIWQMYAPPRKPILNAKLTWREALDAPSAKQMGYLRGLMESRPLLSRVPDQTLMAGDPGAGAEHARATRGDGYALFYAPTGKPFRVNLEKLTGKQVKAWWFDPRIGKSRVIGQFAREGEREFTPPGEPGVGNDWVLVLDDPQRRVASDPDPASSLKQSASAAWPRFPASRLSASTWRPAPATGAPQRCWP